MAEEKEIPRFPDITPSRIIRTEIKEIGEFDITEAEGFRTLVNEMFEYPERRFYYFQEKDGQKNQFMISKDREGEISFAETEFFYYRRPNSERGYIHLERRGGNYKDDWEREIVEKGPMFMRTTLRLTERTRRHLETLHRLQLEEEFKRKRKESEYSFDVFISYSTGDSNEANQIYDAISTRGRKAFLSEKTLRAGEDFAEKIRSALLSSRELWLLVSPNSLNSDWVISEWGAAWALNKTIVPILHRCSPNQLPDRIRRLHCVDLYKLPELIVERFPPKEWKITRVFTPENEAELIELDEFMEWPAHSRATEGFVFPDEETGKKWVVFCKSYAKDDSDQSLRKRHMVLVQIREADDS